MIIDRFSEGCALPQRALEHIQRGILNYTYKGVPTYKSPFDLALYQLLLLGAEAAKSDRNRREMGRQRALVCRYAAQLRSRL